MSSATTPPERVTYAYLLLLVFRVFWNERGESLVHTALVQPLFKLFLNGYIQRVKLRANVQSTTLPVRFCSQIRTELGIRVKRNVVHKEGAILTHRVHVERALDIVLFPAASSANVQHDELTTYLGDRKRHANGIRFRGRIFATLVALLLKLGLLFHVLNVRDREHDTDAGWTSACTT